MRKTCLDTIYDLAKKNKKILFIGSDLGPGVLDVFKKKFPDRFLMEGVAEQAPWFSSSRKAAQAAARALVAVLQTSYNFRRGGGGGGGAKRWARQVRPWT